jgi:hypothetical protein
MKRGLCIGLSISMLLTTLTPPLAAQPSEPAPPVEPAPSPAPADSTQSSPVTQAESSAPLETQLRAARELLKAGDYDRAVELLRGSVDDARGEPETQREAYLLLIKAYVFLGNDFKFKPQGRMASGLNYKEAKATIAECLAIPALRHTKPEPADEYPPEMHALFAEVRSELFGSFRVVDLAPENAVVTFDGDTLHALPGEPMLGDVDLPVGPHHVVVMHDGYEDFTDEVTISPNAILERSYTLEKRHGKAWYAAWIGGAALVVGGAVALITGGSSGDPFDQPLPGPPDPPASGR